MSHTSALSPVPRHLHQLWKDGQLPRRYADFAATWRKCHPEWSYTLWTDEDLRRLVAEKHPHLLTVFDGYSQNICRADLGRYLVLQSFGGVYVDLDCECLQPIDSLVSQEGFAIAYEPAAHGLSYKALERGVTQIPCPSFIISSPGHAFWGAVIEEIQAGASHPDVLDATGPFLLTRALRGYSGEDPVVILPTELVYPVAKDDCWNGRVYDLEFWERATRGAHVLHYWDGGWFPHPSAPLGLPVDVPVAIQNPQLPPVEWKGGVESALVSCLMVTRGRGTHVWRAIHCFLNQSYPHRELVIVTEAAEPDLRNYLDQLASPLIRVLEVGHRGLSLGELRNEAIAHSRGELVCQWDDDDVYDPDRLKVQVFVLQQTGAVACLLQRWLIWWPEQERLAVSTRRCWEGSILALKSALPAYPRQRRGEDTAVVEQLMQSSRLAIFDLPRLYLYVVHGDNTFPPEHFTAHWECATAQYTQPRYEAVLGELAKRLVLQLG